VLSPPASGEYVITYYAVKWAIVRGRVILGPVYDKEKENWRILTNKEIYAMVKNPTIIETIRLHRFCTVRY
jgi:hypothetical protein